MEEPEDDAVDESEEIEELEELEDLDLEEAPVDEGEL